MYKVSIKDRYENYIEVTAQEGETLFTAIGRHQPPIFKGNCGGRGQCMSCNVFVEEQKAYKKACQTIVGQDLHVLLPFSIEGTKEPKLLTHTGLSDTGGEGVPYKGQQGHDYGIAVDIGTTSIGMCLMDLKDEASICEYNLYNPQAVYGADVISRIAYAGKKEHAGHLQELIWEQLLYGMHTMLAKAMLFPENVTDISIAANTTMLHLLSGYDVSGLGSYPFHTEHLQAVSTSMSKLSHCHPGLKQWQDVRLRIFPGCSAFVGADIVAGATALSLGQKEKYDLLIDLGTNGEILLLNANQGYAGAAACGSAFDAYVTADGHGADLISRIALLRKRGIIRENGSLMERYLDAGYVFPDGIRLTQEIIENVLKAKAAIRTGIDMLLETAGTAFCDCNVYIAGNFGFHLDAGSARAIGMLPEEGVPVIVGNASLEGAKRLLTMPQASIEEAAAICSRTRVLEFANDSSFAKRYIGHMVFS